MGSRYGSGSAPGKGPAARKTYEDNEKPDLVSVFEHYGVLVGRSMVQCPLHEDRTPSCSVNKNTGLWNCHSCGEGGDSWTLIMLKEGIKPSEFGRAKDLAASVGFADGSTGGGNQPVSGSRYGGRREVPARQGAGSGGSSYVPAWRRR